MTDQTVFPEPADPAPPIFSGPPPRTRKPPGRFRTWARTYRIEIIASALGFALVVALLSPFIFVTVPAGSVGVIWLRLFGGTVLDYHYGQGLKVIMPWDHVYVFDTRMRRLDVTVTSLTEDGLPVETAVTLRYRVNPRTVGYLYDLVGPEYEQRLLEPSITSEMSEVIIAHKAEALYTLAHDVLEAKIARGIQERLHVRPNAEIARTGELIQVMGFTMRKLTLPALVQNAVNDKVTAQQVAEQYDYILQRERLESQRKAIEAEGVRQFQQIVSSNISETYLRWRGIDATLRLAESPNSKVVVIGNGPGSMPLILGGLDENHGASSSAAAAKTSAKAYDSAATKLSAPPKSSVVDRPGSQVESTRR